MFILAELQDIVRIEPRMFSKDTGQEIADELNRKFANKVCHDHTNLHDKSIDEYRKRPIKIDTLGML